MGHCLSPQRQCHIPQSSASKFIYTQPSHHPTFSHQWKHPHLLPPTARNARKIQWVSVVFVNIGCQQVGGCDVMISAIEVESSRMSKVAYHICGRHTFRLCMAQIAHAMNGSVRKIHVAPDTRCAPGLVPCIGPFGYDLARTFSWRRPSRLCASRRLSTPCQHHMQTH